MWRPCSTETRFSLTIERFRSLTEHFIVEEEGLCDDLIFDLDPEISLRRVKTR